MKEVGVTFSDLVSKAGPVTHSNEASTDINIEDLRRALEDYETMMAQKFARKL